MKLEHAICHQKKALNLEERWDKIGYRDKNMCKYMILFDNWRRERDSNPRYAINVYTLSRRALSTAQTPLRVACDSIRRTQ